MKKKIFRLLLFGGITWMLIASSTDLRKQNCQVESTFIFLLGLIYFGKLVSEIVETCFWIMEE